MEYNKLIEEAGMIDINIPNKEYIQKDVRPFALKHSILSFNSMI